MQRPGIFSFRPKLSRSAQYIKFEEAWYSQPSTAIMSADGTRTACSDARDPAGSYIWREDGEENGRCCGIDFEQAKRKRNTNTCTSGDLVCGVTKVSGFVPYAYDAAIALAHGLDKLVKEGVGPNEMTASVVSQAIKESEFEGPSGNVAFEANGDRRYADLEYIVYNYQVKGEIHGFEDVGRLIAGDFVPCKGDGCRSMMFHDGKQTPPNVQRTVRDTARRICLRSCMLLCITSSLRMPCSSWCYALVRVACNPYKRVMICVDFFRGRLVPAICEKF